METAVIKIGRMTNITEVLVQIKSYKKRNEETPSSAGVDMISKQNCHDE